MEIRRINLWEKEEYTFRYAREFIPNLRTYLHEDSGKRPAVLVVPGGAYAAVAATEGEIVAQKFYQAGYQAFVLTYTTNMLMSAPLYMQPMKDISRAVRMLRAGAEDLRLDLNRITVCGFSAGGHLCGCLCVHHEDIEDEKYGAFSNRPDSAIFSYAVFKMDAGENNLLCRALLGVENEAGLSRENKNVPGCNTLREACDYLSVEKWVTDDMPPCFLWQTAEDELIPFGNIQAMTDRLYQKKADFTCHIFSKGPHGLSTADDTWAAGEFGELYTAEQSLEILNRYESGEIELSQEELEGIEIFKKFYLNSIRDDSVKPNAEAAQWFALAVQWLKTQNDRNRRRKD